MARFKSLPLVLTMSVLILAGAEPATAKNVVRWARGDGVLTWDPHGAFTLASFNGYRQVYETLTTPDDQFNLVPGLAVSWRLADATTWRFELRDGVTFHEGTPLTAEDVVFSVERALGEGSDLASLIGRNITGVSAVDDRIVKITTKRLDPFLPTLLRVVSIMSKGWAERHGVTAATLFNEDQGTFAGDHANGTGPFMLESHEPGQRTVFVRNPNWWGLAEHPHNIDRIVLTITPDAQRRVEGLLNGEIDLLRDPPSDALDRIRTKPGLKVAETWSPRVVFLGMNQGKAELSTSDLKGQNPLKDRRVRRAIYQAIDVEALRDNVLNGLAEPTGMLVVRGIGGYSKDLDQRLPNDPNQARALLAAAGYAHGFALRLDCPRARWNGEALCAEIARQLGDAGLRITVDALPEREWFRRIRSRETDFYLFNEFTTSFDSLEILREYQSKPSTEGATGYANPALDALIEQIAKVDLTYARDSLIEKAWKIILDDIVVVPLYRPTFVWAMRERLDIPVSPLDIPYFYTARLH